MKADEDNPRDSEGDLVWEQGAGAYMGLEPTSKKVIDALLRWCLITMEEDSRVGFYEHYRLNEYGRRAIDHEAVVLREIFDAVYAAHYKAEEIT